MHSYRTDSESALCCRQNADEDSDDPQKSPEDIETISINKIMINIYSA